MYEFKDRKLNTRLVKELKERYPDPEERYEILGKSLFYASYKTYLSAENYQLGRIVDKALEMKEFSCVIEGLLNGKIKEIERTLKKIKIEEIPESGLNRILFVISTYFKKSDRQSYADIGECVERALSSKRLQDVEEFQKWRMDYALEDQKDIAKDEYKARCFLEEENAVRGKLIEGLFKK
ncbi:MAG: hypothetical protein DRP12_03835 [Candidatus Aenigmatarchaeota archaeon]|nr:MAG: hypothetical protein DRP12_03835 [Candidatus Aenigmarchaeota archaeon]